MANESTPAIPDLGQFIDWVWKTKAERDCLRDEVEQLRSLYDTSELKRLRAELEAARGLLEQRIPCDVMLPPATTIKRGCSLSTVLASMKMREEIPPNQRVFTATPAPEVPDHSERILEMVERGAITVERDFVGTMHIKVGDFDAVQVRYQYPHTDNASTRRLAERIADMLRNPLAEQGERQEAVPEETPHIIVFDDADRPDEKFSGAGARPAALRRWQQISMSWNAHLFVRVERNSRDDPYPCARLASQVNRIPAGLYAELEALRTLRDATGVYLQGYMRDEIEDEESCSADQHDAACSVKSALDNARALEWKGGDK